MAEDEVPTSIKELQHFFGDGTSIHVTNAFYEDLDSEQGLEAQAKTALRKHSAVNDWIGGDEHTSTFVHNMRLISETKIEKEEDLKVLKTKLYTPEDFQTELLMDGLLNNRDDSEEATAAFDKSFITLDNSMVQLYYTDDGGQMSGVVVAAKRKHSPHAVYLIFVMD
ncbi:uncharacterized protein LOC114515768 isoform X2 [Dendronephthya gigantea]|uniref:uncharacterized protein LOC114515768 isoform X2 n=1 Tax=Dendronephthya gigantea TaxID=151771 RepID=UPI00106C2E6C|nr:uncharacterized protein LOC114515768 isoform X2 [Dendronephthya gigantea]